MPYKLQTAESIENYDRKKATAIAILKQRANTLYGLPVDRFARSCGIRLNKTYKPSTPWSRRWSKQLKSFVAALTADGTIVVQKTFPLITNEPYRVYLAGTQPPFQMLRSYTSYKRAQGREREALPIHPRSLRADDLQPKEKSIKQALLQLTENDYDWRSVSAIDALLLDEKIADYVIRGSLCRICQHLAAIGVFQRQYFGKDLSYRRTPDNEKHFDIGCQVITLPGTPSEKYGIVQAVQDHPLYPTVQQLTVAWEDGTRSLTSNELTYVCVTAEEQSA
ncbi:MAG: hypothetical protein KME27_10930 [Lyngbya sp. HA4199-MV5]|jgi:hypothetical protein|nr:hypothetical protein [Lyngbya sp. HA4199-MV5]